MKLQARDLRRCEVERANMHKARSREGWGGAGRGRGGEDGGGGEGGGGGGEVSTFTTLHQPLKNKVRTWKMVDKVAKTPTKLPNFSVWLVSPKCCFRNIHTLLSPKFSNVGEQKIWIVRRSPPRHSPPQTFTISDVHHFLCKIRHSPPQTFTTLDFHHLRRSPPQTFTTPDVHHLRHSPPPV